jgi:cell division transport system permease protein
MKRYYQRAIKDILDNRFLAVVTLVTIALSILIASSFALFFINAGDLVNVWQKGIRMMVYLKDSTTESGRLDTKFRLQSIAGVKAAVFISRDEALKRLKTQMQHHAALLDNLKENPLPDAFEITLQASARTRRWNTAGSGSSVSPV